LSITQIQNPVMLLLSLCETRSHSSCLQNIAQSQECTILRSTSVKTSDLKTRHLRSSKHRQ